MSPSIEQASATSARRLRLHGLSVALVALAVYLPALTGSFVYDDYALVDANPWIQSPVWLGEVFRHQLFGFNSAATASAAFYRPLTHVALLVIHTLAGVSPWAYHLLSVLLHAVASVTLWSLTRRLAGELRPDLALAAGLLFAVHPVHVEAVAWISGLMDVATTTAGLGAMWMLATRGLTPRRAVAGAALWLVALLFKEVAALVPLMLLAWEFMDTQGPRPRREFAWRYGALCAAGGLYLAMRWNAVGWAVVNSGWAAIPPSIAGLNALPLLASYARLLTVPSGLSIFHDFEPSTSFTEGPVVLGALVLVALLVALARLRTRVPLAWLGLLWLILPLLPALHLRALGESPVAERYAYLPSAGLCILLAMAWNAWATRAPQRSVALLVGIGVLVVATAKTSSQVLVWQDEVSLWSNAVDVEPASPVPAYQLGATLLREGEAERALPVLEHAVVVRPTYSPAVEALAQALLQSGQAARARELLEAAIPSAPTLPSFHFRLGEARRALGDLAGAAQSFREAARLDTHSTDARVSLGEVLLTLGDVPAAREALDEARALSPSAPAVLKAWQRAQPAPAPALNGATSDTAP
ncbi:tetratricopeptide repeat protein [Corallococcus sp. M34]|uniref:tetratricopeptide repeat protein n=1 Tax=Citreicoccus inhibens TaxID=2849499 RepID=UPI001C249B10|nr:tetratricopeptide repeat protein [Citreicoccus inhibens]MBU8895984.1 tetratricopeptide repeat protein [Citreicoccus inhibens]